MDFTIVVQNILGNFEYCIESRVCPDQYFGQVTSIGDAETFSVRKHVNIHRTTEKYLILILESPHIKEFKDDPGPAKGKTGMNIVKFLLNVNGLESFGNHGLIVMNAVQYQCSLGFATKKFRDRVFTEMWNTGSREDFISRLRSIYRPGDTLVNCCTKGSTNILQNELRRMVQIGINQALPTASVVRRNHPSCWHFKVNRQYEW